MHKPGSVYVAISLKKPLLAFFSSRPRRKAYQKLYVNQRLIPSLFDFAPNGVYHALPVTSQAVRSYRPFSPLLLHKSKSGIFSVALSLRLPWPGVTRRRVFVEPGLSSLLVKAQRQLDPS